MPAWWSSLSKLSTLNSWLLGIAAFAGFFAAVFGVAAWKVGDRVAELQDKENSSFRSESEQKIAEAAKGSAEANERAQEAIKGQKQLESDAEHARLKQREAEHQTAELQLKIEQEKMARMNLEAHLAPRRISGEQERELRARLIGLKSPNVTFFVVTGNPEISDFASDIERAFRAAGLRVEVNHGIAFGGTDRGISVSMGTNRLHDAQIVAAALAAAKIINGPLPASRAENQPDLLQLMILPK